MATVNLAILGLQRVGTSFGLAAKRYMKTQGAEHKFVITGYDESGESVRAARKLEAIEREARTAFAAVEGADLILLAAPFASFNALYELIAPSLKSGAVLVDLSPLKVRAITRAEKHLPREKGEQTAYIVGATPIINAQYLYGVDDTTEAARADLFDKGTMILSPAVHCRGEAIQLASDFSALIGLRVHFTDPAEHDTMVASIEALPLLASLGLFRTASRNNAWGDMRRIGNPLFAMGVAGLNGMGPEDAAAVMNGNRQQTALALDRLIDTLTELRGLLNAEDELLLAEAFADTMEQHDRWLHDRRKNDWGERTDIVPTEKVTLGTTLMGRFLGRRFAPLNDQDDSKDNPKK